MKLSTRLPLRLFFFKHWDETGEEVGIAIAKAQFARTASGALQAVAAPELEIADRYVADPAWSPLLAEQDLAPGKIGTDLTIRAIARAPGGRPLPDWPVAAGIEGRMHYGFQVRGPSFRERRGAGHWRRSPPEPVASVPLGYDLAYGGRAPGPDDSEVVHPPNPAGIGLITPQRLAAGEPVPLPQIGALAEFMAGDPLAEMTVHGFGPVAKGWLPRRAHAGTFDETWRRERHPRMPADYALRFWNAAPAPMQLDPPLRGDEEIAVSGISHAPEPVRLRLPGVWCGLDMAGTERAQVMMVLDTVSLDLRSEDPAAHGATLVWRATIPAPHRFATAEVVSGRWEI